MKNKLQSVKLECYVTKSPVFYKCLLKCFSVQKQQWCLHLIGCSKLGVYGSNCNIPCPNNCRYRTCHIMNGTCFGCEAGFKGTICATGIFVLFLLGNIYIDSPFLNLLTDIQAGFMLTESFSPPFTIDQLPLSFVGGCPFTDFP